MTVARHSPITRFHYIFATRVYAKEGLYYSSTGIADPGIKYNEVTSTWQYSNDGITYIDISAGSGSLVSGSISAKKYAEVVSAIGANVNHTLPGGISYTKTVSGHRLDVFMNGQLLTPVVSGNTGDYTEINTTTIRFHFDIPTGTLLTYIIK